MSHSAFACIKAAPIFSQLPDALIEELVNISIHQKHYTAGSYIYEPDDDLSALIIVDTGKIDVLNVNENGQELLLYTLLSHQVDVESSLFTDARHHHFARAKTDSSVCMIRRTDFQNLLQKNPTLSLNMLNVYGERLTELEQRQISLSLQSADERLLKYLHEIAAIKMNNTFELAVTKKELAVSLHITPETLSRLFKKLITNGTIILDKRKVIIL
ncbi:Crp/Fnr family transcriptional regulator [Leuconostoc inhae]|uniref:Crp/Fnr family transcriptional regulator n=1 Tax=Leuconostoc inhae TaxID=178001 RepID=UPI001C7DC460|nr:Crp/Fnr family transcriptional regulator [Leuconostoc inhae]